MLLSNKGILPVLWELYPGHPNLLEARFDSPGGMTSWVRKPLLGREGANITLHSPGADIETEETTARKVSSIRHWLRCASFKEGFPSSEVG